MIGRSFQDIYVAACGEPCANIHEGREHERTCPQCQSVSDEPEEQWDDPRWGASGREDR
jgi:rubrerythrin